ncbi:MAG: plasmid pRiA4b ORF-3 family protein [Microthrixaceae bacterium]|nr:plasmid pRiA4b ORF-3 family protein [Microthrixaceae bacterium]
MPELPGMPERTATIIAFPGSGAAVDAGTSTSATPPVQRSATAGSVFQLKVTLLGTKPPIWRRILVDGSSSLGELHEVIQAAFGWWNCHLHDFEIGRTRYCVPDPDWDFGPPAVDERTTSLHDVATEGTSFELHLRLR